MKLLQTIKGKSLVKTGANYSLTATAASVVGMIVSLLNMRWLGPSELGIWQSLCVVTAYVPFLQLGIQSQLNIELPILLGRNDLPKVKKYIATSYYISNIVTAIIAVLGLTASIIIWQKGYALKYVFGIIALTAVNVGSSISYHFIARFRSSMSFDKLTSIIRIQIVVMVLCIPLIYFFGFWGLLMYNAFPGLVYAILMKRKSPFQEIKAQFEKNETTYLMTRGIILMLYGQTFTAIKTFQQMFLLRFGGAMYVGLFSPALAIGGIINLLPGQIAQFLVPQMGYKFGKSSQAKDLWPFVLRILVVMPFAILPVSIVFYFILPWLVNTFFPKYIESIQAMQIMSFGFAFSSSSMVINFLYTLKAYKDAIFIILAEFLSYALLPTFFYKIIGLSILTSLAIGVSLAYFIIYVTTFIVMRVAIFRPKYNLKTEDEKL